MSIYTMQPVFCPACGKKHETDFNGLGSYGRFQCCDKKCHEEMEWRRTLAIMREPYHKDPRLETTETVPRGLSGHLVVTGKTHPHEKK